jgi:hypothetical protein
MEDIFYKENVQFVADLQITVAITDTSGYGGSGMD